MKRIVSILCALTVLVTVFSHPAEAATGMQGYAVYRDGVTTQGSGNFTWHTGIMDKASSDDIYPIIHARGRGYNVQYGHWYEFMNGTEDDPYINNNFVAYYKPNQSITDNKRDAVTATARSLAADFIAYSLIQQIHYDDGNPNGKTFVGVSDIYELRCDGVVEYCYEYNNIRIYGNDAYWDISRWGFNYKDHHAGLKVTPKIQAQNYMTFISNDPEYS